MRVALFGVVGVVLVGLLLSLVLDGGAPAIERDGGREWRPVVERWALVAAAPDDSGGWLCDDATPCDPARQRAHAAHPCAWSARVWLASTSAVVLREVTDTVYVAATREGGALVTSTFFLPWEAGWWWRAESERVDVAAPVPCDAAKVAVTFNLKGRTPTGDVESGAQTVEVALR